jgi:hypothetical protein
MRTAAAKSESVVGDLDPHDPRGSPSCSDSMNVRLRRPVVGTPSQWKTLAGLPVPHISSDASLRDEDEFRRGLKQNFRCLLEPDGC